MAKKTPTPKPQDTPQHSYLGLFRAGMTSPEHRRFITVAREAKLQDALEHLRKSSKRNSKHHFLYIGSRGTGKTHFLSLIEDEIQRDDLLRTQFVVVRFPEESSRILSFADFLLRVCEALANQLPTEKNWETLYKNLRPYKTMPRSSTRWFQRFARPISRPNEPCSSCLKTFMMFSKSK